MEEKHTPAMTRKFKFKPVIAAVMTLAIGASSIMAMDYKLGLGLFFDNENLNNVKSEIQTVKKSNEDGNVRMEVNDAINQGFKGIAAVSLINLGKNEWPKDIQIIDSDAKINGSQHLGGWPSEGVLSADGKEFNYIANINNEDNLLDNSTVELSVTNLGQKHYIEMPVDVALDKCAKTVIDGQKYEVLKLVEALKKENKSENEKLVLSKDYPSISVCGIGILKDTKGMFKGEREKPGIIVQLENTEDGGTFREFTDYFRDNGNYLTAEAIEIKDTKTGTTYKAKNILLNDKSVSYFPEVTEEQIPNLKVTKVEYVKQQVIEEGTWKVEFTMAPNQKIKTWQPEMSFEVERKKEKYTIHIEEVALTTAGVEIKEHTIREKTKKPLGDYNSNWIKVNLVLDTGETMELMNGQLRAVMDGDQDKWSYMLSFIELFEMGTDQKELKRKLIDTTKVKQVMINDKVLEVQ